MLAPCPVADSAVWSLSRILQQPVFPWAFPYREDIIAYPFTSCQEGKIK